MALHPVILAGGAGTRMWPLSRELYPKQFLALASDRSMLQDTISRLDGIEGIAPPVIVCNEEHRFLVAEHMRQLAKTPSVIILEPVGRNTAPAVALAALALLEPKEDSDPVMVVMPADHIIRHVAAFQAAVQQGAALAQRGYLAILGIVPTSPETGYGYIKRGAAIQTASHVGLGGSGPHCASRPFDWSESGASSRPAEVGRAPARPGAETRGSELQEDLVEPTSSDRDAVLGASPVPPPFRVSAFVEKPDRVTAQAYLESGEYLWNSGILIARVSVWLDLLEHHRPDIAKVCRAAYAGGQGDGDFYRPDTGLFTACPGDFIAYAVMEKLSGGHEQKGSAPSLPSMSDETCARSPDCIVIPLDVGWSDVGAWSAVWEDGERDAQGNVLQGDVYAQSMQNSLLIGQHRLLAAVGLENVIAVETADAVLVAHKDHVQDVKDLVARLKAEGRPEHENHRKVHRPWGSYETVDNGSRVKVRRLTLNPGAALSLQMHHHRAEHWVVVKGTAKVTRGDEEFLLTENQSTNVPIGTWHRLENPESIPLELIEVQSGSHLEEDDIVRAEDHR